MKIEGKEIAAIILFFIAITYFTSWIIVRFRKQLPDCKDDKKELEKSMSDKVKTVSEAFNEKADKNHDSMKEKVDSNHENMKEITQKHSDNIERLYSKNNTILQNMTDRLGRIDEKMGFYSDSMVRIESAVGIQNEKLHSRANVFEVDFNKHKISNAKLNGKMQAEIENIKDDLGKMEKRK